MRKVLLLCAAMAVLLVGSLSLGIAAARTGAPVLYDARVQPGAVDELAPGAGSGTPSPGAEGGAADGAAESGEAGAGDGRAAVDARSTDRPGASERDRGRARLPAPDRTATPDPGDPMSPSDREPRDDGRATALPTPTAPPADPEPTEQEQAAWLAFQQLVRDCMTEAGFEYRHWTWWEAESPDPESLAPAMPEQLTPDQQAAWREALYGSESSEGCLVVAVEQDREAASPAPEAPESGDAAPDGGDVAPEAGAGVAPGAGSPTDPEASAAPQR